MLKILLVDDHRAFRKEFLRLPFIKGNTDFEVAYEANDGKEALEIAQQNKIDIIISDIRMPVMNGLELLRSLHANQIQSIFIILSEYGTFEYAQDAINNGAYGYLTKPVCNNDVEAILTKIKNELYGEALPFVTSQTIELLVTKMLANSPTTQDVLGSMFMDIKKDARLHELLCFTEQFLMSIQNRIFDRVPWLSPYISKKIFSIQEPELMDSDYSEIIFSKVNNIQSEINKFGFSLSDSSKTESIQSICIFILNNIMNPELNSGLIADEFFFNKSYLSKLFKEKMSIPMIKFITMAKMEYAKVRLEDDDTRISELSELLNFENPDYFSSIFRKTYGFSPASYQKALKCTL